jgi:DNA-binding beta-propeller fold protein YncE
VEIASRGGSGWQTLCDGRVDREGAEVDPATRRLFISNAGDDPRRRVGRGDHSNRRIVTAIVNVGDGPQTVAADPSKHRAWVVNVAANSISVIER